MVGYKNLLVKALTVAALVPAAVAVVPGTAAADGHHGNPWLSKRVMNMAHSGGENEAPTNTMYAFKRAVALGADMIELDVQSTADRRLVVMHNSTVDETTDGHGKVENMTAARVQALDAAYKFVPGDGTVDGKPASAYTLRGIRTGQKAAPAGYTADDFGISTLDQVFDQFPHTPINIEIKGTSDDDVASFERTGRLLADFLKRSGRTDVIVASFNDAALADFHKRAPAIGLAPAMQGIAKYFLAGIRPQPGTVALQIPVQYQGIPLVTREFIDRAHRDGYAVHIWFSGTASENRATYTRLLGTCADGLMPAKPTLLENILDSRHIVRPGKAGVDPCGIRGPRR
ncbi:MAG: glycerophosphodiester phosphodiesterase family protein [Gordonia sp. (in: high G+C Gram-positive bacteria)]|uniref:glycerophosphodiester phosphodiesterase family protein n=1 Tax=Gordonia sp. (in: high G+C Gram-positive bacteria) TaxID=84139 RepID=UPI0039E563CF